jgi:hypothetical protein
LISQFLIAGNTQALDSAIFEKAASVPSRTLQGALLLASFHEVFLLSVLPAEATMGLSQRRSQYDLWLRNSSALKRIFNNTELAVFHKFASATVVNGSQTGYTSGTGTMGLPSTDPFSFFAISSNSSSDDILRLRVAAHVSAAVLSAADDHPFGFFRSLLISPVRTKDNLFPTMEEDVLKVVWL